MEMKYAIGRFVGFGKRGDPVVKVGTKTIFIENREFFREIPSWKETLVLVKITRKIVTSRGTLVWRGRALSEIKPDQKVIHHVMTKYRCGHTEETETQRYSYPEVSIAGEVKIKEDGTIEIFEEKTINHLCPVCRTKQLRERIREEILEQAFNGKWPVHKNIDPHPDRDIVGRVLVINDLPEHGTISKFVRAELGKLLKGAPSVLGKQAVATPKGVSFYSYEPRTGESYIEISETRKYRDGTIVTYDGSEYTAIRAGEFYAFNISSLSFIERFMRKNGVIAEGAFFNYNGDISRGDNGYVKIGILWNTQERYETVFKSRNSPLLVCTIKDDKLRVCQYFDENVKTKEIKLPKDVRDSDVAMLIPFVAEDRGTHRYRFEFLFAGDIVELENGYIKVRGKLYENVDGQWKYVDDRAFEISEEARFFKESRGGDKE